MCLCLSHLAFRLETVSSQQSSLSGSSPAGARVYAKLDDSRVNRYLSDRNLSMAAIFHVSASSMEFTHEKPNPKVSQSLRS